MDLLKDLITGRLVPKVVYAVIETPKGSRNKYKYDENNGVFALNRVLYSPFHYPADYGIIPKTAMDDGNPLDILVIMNQPSFPGCVVECRPIGMLSMNDGEDRDDKIIGVPVNDIKFRNFKNIQDIPSAFLKEVKHFFQEYKKLEGNITHVFGWKDANLAYGAIIYSTNLYLQFLSYKNLFSLD